MNPCLEEAERLLRLARRDAVEFRYNDDAMPLIDPADALSLADTLIAWSDTQIKARRPSE